MYLYRRATHDLQGDYITPSLEAIKYWQTTDAGFIGHMMDSSTWMTPDEIYAECEKYWKDFEEYPDFTKEGMMPYLDGLVSHGLAEKIGAVV
jgi:hypothetical protein